ncbi:hypothetical protein TELCIR_04911 [Teladorsagia circumcincta]|uniref:Uncharacterized protein n=1 Tax=Teladorsagia circumcincta TaxID=45464 RepID=A0A2G9USB8_TELCI|nr:hypothetical protein TELCIR_04911 [Teladorsagia circumcincta]
MKRSADITANCIRDVWELDYSVYVTAPIPWHRAVGHLARFEMSVVQPPPHLMQFAQTQAALTPVNDDIDLQGGRLIDVVEEEEIDATDGCRVQVITYRIESADGTEQLTKTIRRKGSNGVESFLIVSLVQSDKPSQSPEGESPVPKRTRWVWAEYQDI